MDDLFEALGQQPLLLESLGQLRGLGNAVWVHATKTAAEHDKLTTAFSFALSYQE